MRHRDAVSQRLLGQSQAWNLRGHHYGRTTLQFAGQIRQRYGLAQLHQTDQVGERKGKARYVLRNGAHRGSWKIKRFASRPPFRRWARPDRSTVLHKLGSITLCSGGKIEGRRLRQVCLAFSATTERADISKRRSKSAKQIAQTATYGRVGVLCRPDTAAASLPF